VTARHNKRIYNNIYGLDRVETATAQSLGHCIFSHQTWVQVPPSIIWVFIQKGIWPKLLPWTAAVPVYVWAHPDLRECM